LDIWYVDNQSFFMDLKILFMTIGRVIKRSDIAYEGQATMEKFRGNKE
jgi:lipopolysaccharide/colanic/teichoic acid biosynthesis glycosyltransferase